MTLYDLVKDSVEVLDENACLLKGNDKFILISEDEANKHGAYLYFDNNDLKWIRSGKVTGRPFAKREKEHKAKAKARFCTSKFYRRYPSIERPTVSTSKTKRGLYENLLFYVALGFEIDNKEVEGKITATEGETLFIFDENDIACIKKLNTGGRFTWQSKAREVVSYLIELAFDLCIAVVDNVSENPGFEGCHGVW